MTTAIQAVLLMSFEGNGFTSAANEHWTNTIFDL